MAKRETNAERRERESERRTSILAAKMVAESINLIRRTKPESVSQEEEEEIKRLSYDHFEHLLCEFCLSGKAPYKFLRLVADFLEGELPPYSPGNDWHDDKIKAAHEEATNRNLVKNGLPKGHLIQFLASPDAVKRFENWRRHLMPSGKTQGGVAKVPPFLRKAAQLLPAPSEIPWPTFSEFLAVFREQNPQLLGASDRSLRRSLKRLGLIARPDKCGRPKGKRDRKPRVTR